MIIPNGTIQFKHKSAGGIDEATGYARKSTATWGEASPAQIVPKSINMQSRTAQSEHTITQSYEVYLNSATPVTSEQVRLTWDNGRTAEFSVISVEELRAVSQTRILL